MKKLILIVIAVSAAILILSFAKNMIVKASFEKAVELITGLRLEVESIDAGILKTFIGIKNLMLFNPEGYKDKIMVDIPEIYVDYDLPAIMKGKVHLKEMRLNLKEFVVVKNEKGELNLNSLKVVQAQNEGEKPAEEEKEKIPEIQIDSLGLQVGKVIYKDYSKGGVPSVIEFNINLDEKYENITNPRELASLIITKTITKTTIARLANFDLGPLIENLPRALKKATKAAAETVEKTAEISKELGEKAEKATKETVEKAAETIKKILPLGE